MKKVKAFLFIIPAVVLLLLGKLWVENADYSIQKTESVKLDGGKWSLLVAKSVNERKISVESSGRAVTRVTGAFVTSGLDIMVPAEYANDVFDCCAYQMESTYTENGQTRPMNIIHLERGNAMAEFSSMDDSTAMLDNEDGTFVSVAAACSALNLEYTFDTKNNKLIILPKDMREDPIPARYDLRDWNRAPEVRNQGTLGTCWAFAALSCVESVLLPREQLRLSIDHLTGNNSFNYDLNRGGAYTMGMAYLLGWQGPVYEKDDPYADGKTDSTLPPVKHVQEIKFIKEKDYEEIKRSVYKYGAVETNIYNSMANAYEGSVNYNGKAHAYIYTGGADPNHEIIIVGWDDNYPKENFTFEPEGNGAFICQNSWGTAFGEDGYFYVSYYDTNIGKYNLVYTSVEPTDNYDDIYQSDLCGWVGQIGTGNEETCAMNVFTARKDSDLDAIGFYATAKGCQYKLYVIHNFKGADSVDLANIEPVEEGSLDLEGYYTIPINKERLRSGERFAIALDLVAPGADYPIAVEHSGTDLTRDAVIHDGEGYISIKGKFWSNTEGMYNCNVCLKGYTK
ncbi:MAG: cell surface protein [Lachnospiraceae bacterium]|nr:cell surface protein [Lachnospiraceae bacterium]